MSLLDILIGYAQTGGGQAQASPELLSALFQASQVPNQPLASNSPLDQMTSGIRLFSGLSTPDAIEELVRRQIESRNLFTPPDNRLAVPQRGFFANLLNRLLQGTQTATAPPATTTAPPLMIPTATAPTPDFFAPARPASPLTGAQSPVRTTTQPGFDVGSLNASINKLLAGYLPQATGFRPAPTTPAPAPAVDANSLNASLDKYLAGYLPQATGLTPTLGTTPARQGAGSTGLPERDQLFYR